MSVFFSTARYCGVKTIIGVSVVAVIGVFISNVIYRWALIKDAFSYTRGILSIGGTFWGGVSVSLAAMIVFTWLLCISIHLLEKSKKELGEDARWFKYLISMMVVCIIIWLFASSGMRAVFENMTNWNAFHGTAWVFVHIPWLIVVIGVVSVVATVAR